MIAVAAVWALLPGVAHACSCASGSAKEMLNGSDAAFLGRLEGKSGGLLGGDATWTFKVTKWIKRDLGPTVRIRSAADGAACGFELEPGQEAAIFVTIDGDVLRGGLCSTMDADAVRAHLQPQRAVDTAATLLVAAGGSAPHLWLFDDRGRLAGVSEDSRGEWLADVALCPKGHTAVELWEGGTVVVRDLRSFRAKTIAGPRNLGRVWCRNADGSRLLGARRSNATGDYNAIVDLRSPRRPLVSGDWVGVELAGRHLVVTVGREHTQLRRISLATGDTTLLHTATSSIGNVHVGPSIESFSLDPARNRVAFEVTNYPENGAPSSDAFVRSIADRTLLAHRHIAGEGDQLRWLDDQALLFTTYDNDAMVLDAGNLATRTTLPDKTSWPAVRRPAGTLLGMDGPRLSSLAVPAGRVRTLASIPAEYSSWIIPLPEPLEVQGPEAATNPPAPEPTPEPTPSEAGAPVVPRNASPPPDWFVLGAVALALALAAGTRGLRRRRRT